jgi:murein DD-endopeptidase MepM/ murein hydrolase activator NlpD
MTSRSHLSLLSFAPGAPGQPFLSLLCLLLVGGPLFLLGVVQVLENNVRAFAERQASSIVFRVVLKKGVTQVTAEELALKWRDSGDWDAATVTLADDVFQKIPELEHWMNEAANRLLVTTMPVTVDLQPAGLLTGRADPARLAASLEGNPEVDHVFFDEDGMRWLLHLGGMAADVGLPLRVLFLCLALVGSLVAGIALARAASPESTWVAPDREPSRAAEVAAWLPVASGVVATTALAGVQLLVHAESSLTVVFLTAGQGFFLVFAGLVLAVVTEIARRFGTPGSHFAAQVLLIGLLAWGAAAHPATVQAAATTVRPAASPTVAPLASPEPVAATPEGAADTSATLGADGSALPPASLESLTGAADLGALTMRQRDDLLTTCRGEIELRNKTEQYLRECMTRTNEERARDERSETVSRQKLVAARRDLDVFQRSLSQRYDALRSLRAGLLAAAGVPTVPTGDLAGGAARSRRTVAQCLLTGEARQALSLLDNDRGHFSDARKGVTSLENEERRLEILRTHARQSPEEIRAEIERSRQETLALRAREALILSAPAAPETPPDIQVANASARPAAVPGAAVPAAGSRGVKAGATPEPYRAAPGTLALPGARGDEGYLLLCPAGSLIHAVRDGKVLHAAHMAGMGGLVTLDHGSGLSTLYGELEEGEIGVQAGQAVKAGEILGTAGIVKGYQGRGGVRFEVRKNGTLVKPAEGIPGLTMTGLDNQLLGKKTAQP